MSGEHRHEEYEAALAELEERIYTLEGERPEPIPEPPKPSDENRKKATLGAYPGNFSQKPLDNLAKYETQLGRELKFVIGNLGIKTWADMLGSSTAHFGPSGWKNRPEVIPCITIGLAVDSEYVQGKIAQNLTNVANGVHDSKYIEVAQKAVAAGCSNMIWRIGHEADALKSYPWSFTAEGSHVEYIAAWRHIAQLLKRYSADFKFDYQGAGQWEKINPITKKPNGDTGYPGDDVVDIIGLDKYNRSVYQPWSNMVNALDYNRGFAIRKGKLASMPEWGLRIDETGDDPTFINNMADWIDEAPASGPGAIAYHGYFWAWEQANLDNAPKSKAVFMERFGT